MRIIFIASLAFYLVLSQVSDLSRVAIKDYFQGNWTKIQRNYKDEKLFNVPDNISQLEKMDTINKIVNAYPPITDKDNYGVDDYWAEPQEFIKRGGDCEDYAIAKYFTLVQNGFDPKSLALVIILDDKIEEYHAILEVSLDNNIYILDNRNVTKEYRLEHYKFIAAVNNYGYKDFYDVINALTEQTQK